MLRGQLILQTLTYRQLTRELIGFLCYLNDIRISEELIWGKILMQVARNLSLGKKNNDTRKDFPYMQCDIISLNQDNILKDRIFCCSYDNGLLKRFYQDVQQVLQYCLLV